MDYSSNSPASSAVNGKQDRSVSCIGPTVKGKKKTNKKKRKEQPLRLKTSIHDLPNNILKVIFSYLDVRQRFRIELVCRKWRLISKLLPWNNPSLLAFTPTERLSTLHITSNELTDHILLALLSRCGACLKRLCFVYKHIDYVIITSRSLSTIGKSCPNLEKMAFIGVPVDVGTLTIIARGCPKLKEFTLYDARNSDFGDGVLSIMQHCVSLESIQVSNVILTDDWFKVVNPKLKQVDLNMTPLSSAAPLQNLISRCDSLEELRFNFLCELSVDEVMRLFNIFNHFKRTLKKLAIRGDTLAKHVNWCDGLKNLHHLQELSLRFIGSVEDKLIACVVEGCPKLEMLEIPGSYVTDPGAASLEALPLKVLDVSCNRSISDKGLSFICKKGIIVECSVSFMHNITEDFCCSLARTCPKLREFDVSANGENITNRVVNAFRLAIQRQFLQPPIKLIVGCTNVSTRVKRCAGLDVEFTSEYEEAFVKDKHGNLCFKKLFNSSYFSKK